MIKPRVKVKNSKQGQTGFNWIVIDYYHSKYFGNMREISIIIVVVGDHELNRIKMHLDKCLDENKVYYK